jgi:nucleoside-diphosphate-sugar epimerase
LGCCLRTATSTQVCTERLGLTRVASATEQWGLGSRTPRRTLLVGCGKLGMLLGERLVASGGKVTAIRRRADGLPASFAAIEADLRHPLDRGLVKFDSVVFTLPPGPDDAPIYPTALLAVADALPAPPKRVVFVSSTRVFEGREGTQVLTEQDAPAVVSARAARLLEGERLAVELFDACIVRPAGIYGPGRDSLIRRVIEAAPVDYTRRTNRIHETDLAALLETLLRAGDPPDLIHAVDQEPVVLGAVVAHIAAALGVGQPPHAERESGGGTVLGGSLLLELVGTLHYPTFRQGYDEMIAARMGV